MYLKLREKISGERQKIPEVISIEEREKEEEKTKKILAEVEMIMKLRKRLVD